MKKTQKIKYLFTSSLYLTSSLFAIVACGSKNDPEPDNNYINFVNTLKDLPLSDKFVREYSSFSLHLQDPKLNYSVDNLNENKIKIYDINEPKKNIEGNSLTSFKDNKITFDEDNNIKFKINNHNINLKNIYFSSNFDVKLTNKKSQKSMLFNNITAFFQLKQTSFLSNKINLDFVNWEINQKVEPTKESYSDIDFELNYVKNKTNNYFDGSKNDFGVQEIEGHSIFTNKDKMPPASSGHWIFAHGGYDHLFWFLTISENNTYIELKNDDKGNKIILLEASDFGVYFNNINWKTDSKELKRSADILGKLSREHSVLSPSDNFEIYFNNH